MKWPNDLMDEIGSPVLTALFLILLWLQWRFPLRRCHFGVIRRLLRNFIMSLPGLAIIRLAMLPVPIALSIWTAHHHFGLLNWIALPPIISVLASFLLMDYIYWW